jgi:hypothetical protein
VLRYRANAVCKQLHRHFEDRGNLPVQAQDTPQHVDVPGKSIERNSLMEHNDGNW